jgi:hypothetical protein
MLLFNVDDSVDAVQFLAIRQLRCQACQVVLPAIAMPIKLDLKNAVEARTLRRRRAMPDLRLVPAPR